MWLGGSGGWRIINRSHKDVRSCFRRKVRTGSKALSKAFSVASCWSSAAARSVLLPCMNILCAVNVAEVAKSRLHVGTVLDLVTIFAIRPAQGLLLGLGG